MLNIEGIMQSYHCTLREAMKLTLPQIVMLGAAGRVNYENAERRAKAKARREHVESNDNDPVVYKGLTSTQLGLPGNEELLDEYLNTLEVE